MSEDSYRPLAEAFALGALEDSEGEDFAAHAAGCAECGRELRAHTAVVDALGRETPPVLPDASVRQQLLDLAEAPELPIDESAIAWEELLPGVRVHVHREDPARGVRACLVLARPGSRHPTHRHHGAETILVLKGSLRDERGVYGPGEICRSAAGSVHSEEVVSEEDCLCYVVYYGELEMLE